MTDSDRTDLPSTQGIPSEYRSLASVWRALSRGELIVHSVSTQGANAVVVFVEQSPEEARTGALPGATLALLERALDGTSLKVIAAELDLSPSTVSTRLSNFARKLGVPGRVAALPMVLAELRCADRVDSPMTGAIYRFEHEGSRNVALVLPRAESALTRQLAPAEFEVCQLFVGGLSHREIAERRRTSVRTTANQVAAVFRRLKVSGRLELLARLANQCIAGGTPSMDCGSQGAPDRHLFGVHSAYRSSLRRSASSCISVRSNRVEREAKKAGIVGTDAHLTLREETSSAVVRD